MPGKIPPPPTKTRMHFVFEPDDWKLSPRREKLARGEAPGGAADLAQRASDARSTRRINRQGK